MKGGISEVEVMKIIGLREKGLYFKKISELTGYTAKKVEYITRLDLELNKDYDNDQ